MSDKVQIKISEVAVEGGRVRIECLTGHTNLPSDHALRVRRGEHGEFRCLAKNLQKDDEIIELMAEDMPSPSIRSYKSGFRP